MQININDIFRSIAVKINTTGGIISIVSLLIGTGFALGRYYEGILQSKEISDLNNKHTIEVLDLKNQVLILTIKIEKDEKGKK